MYFFIHIKELLLWRVHKQMRSHATRHHRDLLLSSLALGVPLNMQLVPIEKNMQLLGAVPSLEWDRNRWLKTAKRKPLTTINYSDTFQKDGQWLMKIYTLFQVPNITDAGGRFLMGFAYDICLKMPRMISALHAAGGRPYLGQ